MLRLSVDTKLAPQKVMDKASEYFGQKGLKLDAERSSTDSAVYTGGGGYVSIQVAGKQGGSSEVIVETQEWEYDARHFGEMLA